MSNFKYNPPNNPFLDILYQDQDIIVVNKSSGILSVPGRLAEYHDSILTRVRANFPQAHAVHRLDLGTSGVMVVGLNKNAISNLGQQFEKRKTHKEYIAKVFGIIDESGYIDAPMRLDIDNRPYQIIDFTLGKAAYTEYQRLDIIDNCSIVKLTPKTGRSHQLRLHMSYIGHPILGDHLYANDNILNMAPRLCLHAYYLQFYHPKSNEKLAFKAPCDFVDISHYLL